MKIIGIDPGIAIAGYGVLEQRGNRLIPLDYGCIRTEASLSVPARLKRIYDEARHLFQQHNPDVVAVEKLFFNRNVTTAFTVGQARGVILLASEEAGVPVTEYTPLQVKMAVVGYGQAEKRQVQEMVRLLLSLSKVPKPDDAADALAVAICQAHSSTGLARMEGGEWV
ncbi:MAG: crossover junction endodeoxyribonuclease RuvC [Planifilum sp.]